MGFIRKVYGILATQLLLTAFFCLLPYTNNNVKHFLITHFWMALAASISALVISCALTCCSNLARQVPTNYILLFVFTFLEAYAVGSVCAIYQDGLLVLTAAFMTAGIVIGLTIYAIFTKTDFTVCGGALFVVGAAFIMFSLFSFMFGPTMRMIYAALGVILFGFYLIFDT